MNDGRYTRILIWRNMTWTDLSAHMNNVIFNIMLYFFIIKSVMIAQWHSSLSVLPVARVQFPATAEYFKGFSPD